MQTKHCPACQTTKEITEYNKGSRKAGGVQTNCRDCTKRLCRSHYARNKKAYYENNTRRQKEKRALVFEMKSKLSCSRCSENHPAVLDFHHLDPSTKEGNLSSLFGHGASAERIKKELEKCIVLCANCHRKEHFNLRSSNR